MTSRYRARHRRNIGKKSLIYKLAPPAAVSMSTLAVAGVLVLHPRVSHSGYEDRPEALSQVDPTVAGFSAKGLTIPLDSPIAPPPGTVNSAKRKHKPTSAAPVTKLPANLDVSAKDIPRIVLAAYVNAARLADRRMPACHLQWQVVAGIGYIESDNARSGGSYEPHWNGVANPPIYGPLLDGKDGTARIADTDGGKLDGNSSYDRAVGPMQFLPATWERYAADGNHDGIKDPQQIDDATLAAADYLCADNRDLSNTADLRAAVFSYNHSKTYVFDVLHVAARYLGVSLRSLGIKPGYLGVTKENPRARKHPRVVAGSHSPSVSPTASPSHSPSPSSTAPRPTPTPTNSSTRAPTPTSTTTSPYGSPSTSQTPAPTRTAVSPSSSPSPSSSSASSTTPPSYIG